MAADAAEGEPGFEALLDRGTLDAPALHALADRIAALHARAQPAGPDAIAAFRAALAALAGRSFEQARELEAHAARLDTRAVMGRMRLLGDAAAPNATDVLHDLALPLMELWRSGRAADASILANRYVDVAPQGATGWALLPLYVSLRATQAGDPDLAGELLRPAAPRLVAIGGLSGTGKSTLARLIAARKGRAPGARVLRSDVFRKRLAGVSPETRLPPAHYSAQNDAETWEALFQSADDHLACGNSVILDAVFMRRAERDVAEMLAQRHRLPFTGIWLEAPERDRLARVAARANDASDAGPEVVRDQSRRSVGELGYWHRMRVNRPLDMIVPAARAILDRPAR
jgi:predicted kinase